MKTLIALGSLVCLGFGTAFADIISYSGTTDPAVANFNRPTETGTAISSNVPYATFAFSVSTGGSYKITLQTTESNPDLFDTFLILYTAPFNSGSPLTNFVLANDNANDSNIPLGSALTTPLTVGVNYVLAITGLTADDYGGYTGQIASVPEPSTVGLFSIATLAMIFRYQHFRKQKA